MEMNTLECGLNQARTTGTLIGFARNQAKRGCDVRSYLNKSELDEVGEEVERQLKLAEEARRQQLRERELEQAERLRKKKEYEDWCATLPEIGIKVVDFCRQANSASLQSLYSDLRRFGIQTHTFGSRRWITKEDADLLLVLKECDTKTGWSRRGRSVPKGTQPVGTRYTCYGSSAELYSEEQTLPKRRNVPGVAQDVEDPRTLLAVIFSVNRSAKRYRDAASSCYGSAKNSYGRWNPRSRSACHNLAQINSRKKERLYKLKDAGLMWAISRGWLEPVAKHGSLAVYRGYGYCFHSPLTPIGWTATEVNDEEVFVEQKPRATTDVRLKDAIATLENLPSETDGFERAEFPLRKDRPSRNWDWSTHNESDWFDEDYWFGKDDYAGYDRIL